MAGFHGATMMYEILSRDCTCHFGSSLIILYISSSWWKLIWHTSSETFLVICTLKRLLSWYKCQIIKNCTKSLVSFSNNFISKNILWRKRGNGCVIFCQDNCFDWRAWWNRIRLGHYGSPSEIQASSTSEIQSIHDCLWNPTYANYLILLGCFEK